VKGTSGRLSFWLVGGGEFTSPFFFPWPSLTEAFAIRPLELRLSIPGWLATIQFTRSSATSQLNRGSASCIGTSRRWCDMDETRDWSRQSKLKTINSQLGDDSIGRDFPSRKREVFIPSRAHFAHFHNGEQSGAETSKAEITHYHRSMNDIMRSL
jgi:hypothetical protein